MNANGIDFPSGDNAKGWEWINEHRAHWKSIQHQTERAKNVLEIRTANGGMWADNCRSENILLRIPKPEWNSILLTVSIITKSSGEQGGLLLWQNESNWFKLVVEHLENGVHVVLAKQENGQSYVVNQIPLVGNQPQNAIQLQLRRDANDLIGSARADSSDIWSDMKTSFVTDDSSRNIWKVGLYTTAYGESEVSATFSNFQIF